MAKIFFYLITSLALLFGKSYSQLTNMRIVLREEPHLVDVDVATIAVIELDKDIVRLKVGADHGAGMEVAHLVAPVDGDPPASLKICNSSRANFQDLRKKGL